MEINTALAHGNLVAGAAAEGHGVLIGWNGRGDMPRKRLAEIAANAGIPESWLPEPKEAPTQLLRAVRAVAGSLYTVKSPKYDPKSAERRYLARHTFQIETSSAIPVVGEAVPARFALVATLYSPTELVITAESHALSNKLRDEYQTRIDAEAFQAADITAWFSGLLSERFRGVRIGVGWYVPRAHKGLAGAVRQALIDAGWGLNWGRTMIPFASGEELSLGAAGGFCLEVDEILADLHKDRDRARKESKKGDIGHNAAETYMVRLRLVGDHLVEYTHLMQAEHIEEVRFRIHDAMVELDAVLESPVDFATEWTKIEMERRARGLLTGPDLVAA